MLTNFLLLFNFILFFVTFSGYVFPFTWFLRTGRVECNKKITHLHGYRLCHNISYFLLKDLNLTVSFTERRQKLQ